MESVKPKVKDQGVKFGAKTRRSVKQWATGRSWNQRDFKITGSKDLINAMQEELHNITAC